MKRNFFVLFTLPKGKLTLHTPYLFSPFSTRHQHPLSFSFLFKLTNILSVLILGSHNSKKGKENQAKTLLQTNLIKVREKGNITYNLRMIEWIKFTHFFRLSYLKPYSSFVKKLISNLIFVGTCSWREWKSDMLLLFRFTCIEIVR